MVSRDFEARAARWHAREVLSFEDLNRGRWLGGVEFEASTSLVDRYVAITGDASPVYVSDEAARCVGLPGAIAPPGLAGVWARRAYVGGSRLLSGGVMVGQRTEFRRAIPVGSEVKLAAQVMEVDHSDIRRRVVLRSVATGTDGTLFGEVVTDARWAPAE